MAESDSRELLQRLESGDPDAATDIFNRYIRRLMALARSRIGTRLQSRIDAEDIVQSAYRSFFVHACNQEYQLTRAGDLWRLLAKTTVNKLYGQVEKHTAAKRSVDREQHAITALADRQPGFVEVIAMGERLNVIMAALTPSVRDVLARTLQGQSTSEIAHSFGKSERTVRRLLATARHQFEEHLLESTQMRGTPPAIVAFEDRLWLHYEDYVLSDLRGAGGMGKIYRATHRRTGQVVAFKTLHKSKQTDSRAVAQFVQEAEVLSSMQHPHIIRTHGLGRFPGGGFFLVMDYVDGEDLQQRVNRGAVPTQEVLRLMRQIASALQFAHSRSIIHCDLKPANVIVNNDGHAFVTDFGFAYVLSSSAKSKTTSIGGTEGYLAPEVYVGAPTIAADIFALGMLMWVLLTGQRPGPPPLAGTEFEDDPPDLMAICHRCMKADPGLRFAQVADFCQALDSMSR
ncbi:MAG: sigma-70 family RNA polymerase sigma factor [Planctomycetota bacterium]